MFCRNCGAKIDPATGRCTACGTPFRSGDRCGGFWGLVGEDPPGHPPAPEAQPIFPVPPSAPEDDSQPTFSDQRVGRSVTALLGGVCALSVVLVVLLLAYILSLRGRVTSLKDSLAEHQLLLEQLHGQLADLQAENDQLEQSLTRMEASVVLPADPEDSDPDSATQQPPQEPQPPDPTAGDAPAEAFQAETHTVEPPTAETPTAETPTAETPSSYRDRLQPED